MTHRAGDCGACGCRFPRTWSGGHGPASGRPALAEQLLAGLDQRATTLTVQVAALAREAGTLADLDGARALRAEIRAAGITSAEAVLELAIALHRAVLGEDDKVRTVIDRLHELAERGDYAYYADIAH
ncbi:hypothetical protein ACIQWN_37925 [Streptomyces vinaceus]|uniref:hypothetical protein n=1 Tax=Streptomyces vinaceus TaxID=1960 RepID=UPI00382B2449